MPILPDTNLTIADWAKAMNPDGTTAKFAMLLSQQNDIVEDAVAVQGNETTGHRVTIQTGLPETYFRSINQGVPASRGSTTQVTETCAILEGRSVVDIDLASLGKNPAMIRRQYGDMFVEAMNQKFASYYWYGNASSEPNSFSGMSVRYSNSNELNGQNIVKAGGTTNGGVASVWFICHSEEAVFNIFPMGSVAGLQQRDLGEQMLENANGEVGKYMQAYVEWFQWKTGLCVKDWRGAVRIANVEVADFSGLGGTQAPTVFTNLLHRMMQAIYCVPTVLLNTGRCRFYMNRTLHSGLARLAMEKSINTLSIEQGFSQFGTPKKYLSFMGFPIRLSDALLNTETLVA